MQALPAELEALKRQGAEDVKAEQARIAQAAADERTRLLEQTRREIDMRLRIARRELTEHAAGSPSASPRRGSAARSRPTTRSASSTATRRSSPPRGAAAREAR